MKILIILIGVDIVIGVLGGLVHKDLNSCIGLKGLIKHTVVILLVMIFNFISELYSLESYYNLFLLFYFIQYAISILENVYYLDVPIPRFLITRLKEYQESEGLEKWEK